MLSIQFPKVWIAAADYVFFMEDILDIIKEDDLNH
jgi:hypothetical protein